MSGLFGTLNTSKTGMFAQQQVINVMGHNVANAQTEGYSRQNAVLQTSRPITIPGGPGQIGTGVTVESIVRTRDAFLDYRIRRESSNQGKYATREKYLSEIEGIFNEPGDTGISKLVSEFYDGWQTVSLHPEKTDAKQVLVEKSQQLCDELNHSYSQLEKVQKNINGEIEQSVKEVNSLLSQLNDVNKQIRKISLLGNNPNDLLDRRDLLMDKLSTKFGLDTTSLKLNGQKLCPNGYEKINLLKNESKDENYILKQLNIKDNNPAELDYSKKTFSITVFNDNENTTELNLGVFKFKDKNELENFKKKGINIHKKIDPATKKVEWKFCDKNGNEVENIQKKDILESCLTVGGNDSELYQLGYLEVEPKDPNTNTFPKKFDLTIYKNGDSNDKSVENVVNIADFTINTKEDLEVLNNRAVLVHGKIDPKTGEVGSWDICGKDGANKNPTDINTLKECLFTPESGSIAGFQSLSKDINDQIEKLDNLAKMLAYSTDSIYDEKGVNKFLVDDKDSYDNITARNIKVNKEIMEDPSKVITGKDKNSGTTDGARALEIAKLRDVKLAIHKADGTVIENIADFKKENKFTNSTTSINIFEGVQEGATTEAYFKAMMNKLGVENQEATQKLENQSKLLLTLVKSRESVSGVSMDEEMVNLIQSQHCYQANAKMISTVDQLLDVVINGLKR